MEAKFKFGEFVKVKGEDKSYQVLATVGKFVTINNHRHESYLKEEDELELSTMEDFIKTGY